VSVVSLAPETIFGSAKSTALSSKDGTISLLEEQSTLSDQRTTQSSGRKARVLSGTHTKSSSECRLGVQVNVVPISLGIVLAGYC
jgi:hypothetical protein